MDDNCIDRVTPLDMRNIVLKSSLPKHNNAFNFCHLNPGSLVTNFQEFKLIFKDIPFHGIAVSETWFKSKHSSQLFQLEDYVLFRKDRAQRRSGGVALYIKKFLRSKIIFSNASNAQTDILFIEINNNCNIKLAVGVIYNPPNIKCVNELEVVLRNIMVRYSDVLILGDFNINCLAGSPTVKKFKTLMSSFGLDLISKEPTNFLNSSATLIDLAFTNEPNKVNTFTQIAVPGIATTHDLIYGSYYFPINSVNDKNRFRLVRDFRNVDMSVLFANVNALNWAILYGLCDVNEQLSLFNSYVIDLLNKSIPLKKMPVKRKDCGINFSNEIMKYRNIRDFLHEHWKRDKTEVNRLKYIRARNKVNSMIKATKCQFFNDRFSNQVSSSTFWKNFNTYIIPPFEEQKCEITPEEFNKYFLSVFNRNDANFNIDTLHQTSNHNVFYFRNVSEDEVCTHLASIKSNAIGADGIPLRFIRILLPAVLPYLTHILNSGLTKSAFPDSWKIATIIPIPKVRSPITVNDFRPISILPILSKVFEKIIQAQIIDHVSKYHLLNEYQSGFRANHSTTTALLKVIDDITANIEDGKVGALVLLDFSKAFDKVDHSILVSKLNSEFSFSKSACQLIYSYLHLRHQSVKYSDHFSNTSCVTSGVPQGSILGPILFSLYINQIGSYIQQTNNIYYHLFADDLQLYSFGDSISIDEVVSNLNRALSIVQDWSNKHNLTINPSKSQAILLSNKKRVPEPNNSLVINQEKIQFYDKVKSLGLIIDNRMNWNAHVTNLCGKIYGLLSKLWSTAKYLTINVKSLIIRTLVGPLLSYCSCIYLNSSKKTNKMLNVAFNSCARFIYSKRVGDPISLLSKQIFSISLNKYLELSVLTFMFKLIKKKTLDYLF